MKCKSCGKDNITGAKYCKSCGEKLEQHEDMWSEDHEGSGGKTLLIALVILLAGLASYFGYRTNVLTKTSKSDQNKIQSLNDQVKELNLANAGLQFKTSSQTNLQNCLNSANTFLNDGLKTATTINQDNLVNSIADSKKQDCYKLYPVN